MKTRPQEIKKVIINKKNKKIKNKKKNMAETRKCSRDQRWNLDGKTALVTGGTKGIGYVS